MFFSENHNLWRPLGNSKLHARIFVKQIDTDQTSFEESTTVWANLEFSAEYVENLTREQIHEEIREIMSEYCNCMHDCCGHFIGWGYPLKRIGKRTWLVKGSYSRNY